MKKLDAKREETDMETDNRSMPNENASLEVNRNVLWSQLLLNFLERHGIEHCTVSPGSRNTSLIFALDESNIQPFIHVDERSAAFFALGLSKRLQRPVAMICTSWK